MRAILLTCIVSISLVTLLPGQRRGRDRDRSPKEMQNFTFSEQRFDSEAVDREMEFGVYLPKGYDDEANSEKTWPLIIWLHGLWEDHQRFHRRGGAPLLDEAVTDGKLPPCIFVTANGGRSSMYFNREDQRWEDLISQDLLAHLEKTYRVSKHREERAIMGVSMGGMGALRIAFTHPKLFGAVAAHSSAVFAEDPDDLPPQLKKYASRIGLDEVFGNPIEKEPWQKANPVCIAHKVDKKKLKDLRIYFDAGTEDRYGFQVGNGVLHDVLQKREIAHTWRLIDGGGHSWGDRFQMESLPRSFEFIGEMFRQATATAKGDEKADKDAKGSDEHR